MQDRNLSSRVQSSRLASAVTFIIIIESWSEMEK